MSKKSRTLVIALGILVILGAGYYLSMVSKNTVSKNGKADSESTPYSPSSAIGNLESSELVKIEGPGITLEMNNGLWELSYPDGGIPSAEFELDQTQIRYLTYSLAKIWVQSTVDEEPEDISVYGLDNTSSRIIVTDSAGQKAEYILGDMTPSRTSYYIMQKGDPAVYSVAAYVADYMNFDLDSIRQRSLFSGFQLPSLTRLLLESEETRIEICPKTISHQLQAASSFITHVLTSPYSLYRGVNNEALNSLITPFNDLSIADFIDDAPLSLAPYGLDRPFRIFLQTENASVDLLIGNEVEGKRYAKLADAPGVFTLNDMENILKAKPFSLIDKFALLVNIDTVDRLTISGGEEILSVSFQGKGDDAGFFLNGRKAEADTFRIFYQAVISLFIDAEYPVNNPARQSVDTAEITIEYELNTPPGGKASISLIPYNRDFYALRQEGSTEFLISRNQARRIFEAAANVKF